MFVMLMYDVLTISMNLQLFHLGLLLQNSLSIIIIMSCGGATITLGNKARFGNCLQSSLHDVAKTTNI